MSRFGFVGPSYTAGSNAVADEECINFYAETIETPGAQTRWSYFGTPGLKSFAPLPNGPTRGQCWTGVRQFSASGDTLYEVFADGTFIARMDGTLDEFGGPVSIAFSSIELLIVAGGRAYCYNLAANTFIDVTAKLAGGPIQADYGDGYFIVSFAGNNKFQISAILDGTTWPGIQVNAVSVFQENIVSIIVSHRELWVFGSQHAQPYQNTGTDEIYDVIPGALMETGSAATFGPALVDNTVFWVSQDIRGGRQAWRANGYTPQRISTHAVETALSSYSADQIANLVTYSYQDRGHLFWVLYIPNTDCTWVYDVAQSLWHKRASWNPDTATYSPHRSWNHTYAFGKHLVGDWASGTLYDMSLNYLDEVDPLGDGSPVLIPQTAPVMPPPVPVPAGTGLAWAYPTIAAPATLQFGHDFPIDNSAAGSAGTFPASNNTMAGGSATFTKTGGLGTTTIELQFTGFSLGPGALPADAVITHLVPVITAMFSGAQFSLAGAFYFYNGGFNGFAFPHTFPAGEFGQTEFYGNPVEIPPTLEQLAAIVIKGDLISSLPSFSIINDVFTVNGVGVAVYYTSATPSVPTEVPLNLPPIPAPPSPTIKNIRRLRRAPTLVDEMEWVYYKELTLDFATGLPQPQLLDGDGNPRPPQAMLRWSDNRGFTWSNQHILNCGFAGQYNTRVIARRLGRSRYRVFEVSVTDPIPWTLVDAYLRTA